MLTIIIEGGVVQSVVSSDTKEIGQKVFILDYDVNDQETTVSVTDGKKSYPANLDILTVEESKIKIEGGFFIDCFSVNTN